MNQKGAFNFLEDFMTPFFVALILVFIMLYSTRSRYANPCFFRFYSINYFDLITKRLAGLGIKISSFCNVGLHCIFKATFLNSTNKT